MPTFAYTPSFEAQQSSQPRARKVQYGDGYEQRLRFGLNTDPKEWSLTFANRTDTERNNIVAFFETQAGITAFDWTPPVGLPGKFVCEKWDTTLSNCNNNQIRATFRQVFEP